MNDQKQTRLRLILSIAAGLAVATIATIVAWWSIAPSRGIRPQQSYTQYVLEDIRYAIREYRTQTNAIPQQLEDSPMLGEKYWSRFDDERRLLDGWQRPFDYSTDGKNYAVTSFGRDGKPGGFGLNHDLTSANPYPHDAIPTFAQFIGDCPTQGIVGTCIFAGSITSVLCWFLAKPAQLTRPNLFRLAGRIVATVIGAIIVAMCLAGAHIPSGH